MYRKGITRSCNEVQFDIFVHESPRPKAVILNIPGFHGSVEGYNNKYVTLGEDLAARNFEFIRMPNLEHKGGYARGLVEDVLAVIKWITSRAGALNGPLYLMGFSAGGYAAAVAAAKSGSVQKLLLMEPTDNKELIGPFPKKLLSQYCGELYIVMAEKGLGKEVGKRYGNALYNSAPRLLHILPDCDHQFTGTINGQIMSKAPRWAFDGDKTFPNPSGGLTLY